MIDMPHKNYYDFITDKFATEIARAGDKSRTWAFLMNPDLSFHESGYHLHGRVSDHSIEVFSDDPPLLSQNRLTIHLKQTVAVPDIPQHLNVHNYSNALAQRRALIVRSCAHLAIEEDGSWNLAVVEIIARLSGLANPVVADHSINGRKIWNLSEGWDEVTEVCWIFINCVELAVEEHMNTTSPVQERIRIRIRDKFFRDWERLYAMGH